MAFCDVCPVDQRGENCEKCLNSQTGSVTGKVFWQSIRPEFLIPFYRDHGRIPPNSEVVISEIKWKSGKKRLAKQVRRILREYDTLFFEELPERVLDIMVQQPGFRGKVLTSRK